jgi:hypothetical protein
VRGGVGVPQVGEEVAQVPGERVRGPQLPGHGRIHDWHLPFAKLPDNRETKRARGMASAHLALSRRMLSCQITIVIREHSGVQGYL